MAEGDAVEVGQVWRSDDHRNQNCPWLKVLQTQDKYIIVRRYRDREMTIPAGKPLPIPRQAWKAPAYTKVGP